MVSLAVLQRADTNLALLVATEDASALAANLAASQPFEVEVFAEFPQKGDLLPTVQSLLGLHAKGWYATDAVSIVKAVCLAVKGNQTEPQTPDSSSDGGTSREAEDLPPAAQRPASPDSDESMATQSKPHRSRSPRKLAAPKDLKKQAVTKKAAAAKEIAQNEQQTTEAKDEPTKEPSAAINPAWHDLLTACPRDEADTATAIRRTLKRLLGRWQADSVLSAYSERILRIGGVCGRYILNAEGATLRLTALAA
jgi:hypothetical protein